MAKTKKDFTAKDAQNIDLVDELTENITVKSKDNKGVYVEGVAKKKDIPQNRFTARFNDTEWKYLQEKHWTDRISVTDIIRQYVQEDMKKNPEILKKIDELNG